VTIALIDVAGLRSEVDIATDITTALTIWNTGTEMDEAAAIGISQPPRALPGQGDTEGVSETRHYSTTRLPYWNDTIRVTLEEVADDEWRRWPSRSGESTRLRWIRRAWWTAGFGRPKRQKRLGWWPGRRRKCCERGTRSC
jgi:hypothetical protein